MILFEKHLKFSIKIISCFLLVGIFGCAENFGCSENTKECDGLLCEFYDEIQSQFELTGIEKDQGYLFLRDHSELDSTTSRIIIRSTDGIYYAYPSPDGWYAQKIDRQDRITLNELGHALAVKDNSNEMEIQRLLDDALKVAKLDFSNNQDNGFVIQQNIISQLKIDTNFLKKDLELLRDGEISFYQFKDSFNYYKYTLFYDIQGARKFLNKGFYPKIGLYGKDLIFYPVTNYCFTIEYVEGILGGYEEIVKSKIYISRLLDNRYGSPYFYSEFNIYIPKEKRWYGIDYFDELNKKYKILN